LGAEEEDMTQDQIEAVLRHYLRKSAKCDACGNVGGMTPDNLDVHDDELICNECRDQRYWSS